MKINKIKIRNFRNYDNALISFSDNINIIYGSNGSGKTNLVEAINLLFLTKSFRLNNDRFLIKKGDDIASVEGEITKGNDVSKYKIILSKEKKQLEINNTKITKISDYISKLNIVLYSPSDNKLIISLPNDRRNLLNIEISQIYKEYLLLLNKYNKLLKQRNAYLKQMLINSCASKDYLMILTKKLIEYGLIINKYRANYINNINNYITDIYEKIFGYGKLKVIYKSDFNNLNENDLLKKYNSLYKKEMNYGQTIYGIQHDDLLFYLDEELLKNYGSEAQFKNSIISFKLAELKVIYDIKKNYPILVLDDLFSELDDAKINNIFALLNDNVQTFITTAEIGSINKNYLKNSKLIKIINGTIEENV